ncbi:MAG: hypothetical protein EOP62_15925 [Sphingomonadales bacterium]|nr:MAG: hypothetical protein EOP62_15925 [Sphingomonadales bacterium]
MISLRKARFAATFPLIGAAMLIAAQANAQTAGTDLFSYRAGADMVEYPEGESISQMSSSALNLMDESPATDWTAQGNRAVFVIELAEETELSRIAFDTGGIDRKSPKGFTVELSNTSASSGFEQVLSGTLRMNANGQSFAFKPEDRPTGRWVRLTLTGNYGAEYTALTGFHGYGRVTSQSEDMPDFSGSYEGRSGLGFMHISQEGDKVTGCYAYQQGEVSGTVIGRVMKLNIIETDSSGDKTYRTGFFQVEQDGRGGFRGLVRGNVPSARDAFADYYSAEKTSNNPGGC